MAFTPKTDSLTIMDVHNKKGMKKLAEVEYVNEGYSHQGWFTGNHDFVVMNDEMDERAMTSKQRTLIWDVRDLQNPKLTKVHLAEIEVIDHNEYIVDNAKSVDDSGYKGVVFQSNYEGGLRILDISKIEKGKLSEIAFFDHYPASNSRNFRGSWSVFPYFKDHRDADTFGDVVVAMNINFGLFVLRHTMSSMDELFGEYIRPRNDSECNDGVANEARDRCCWKGCGKCYSLSLLSKDEES